MAVAALDEPTLVHALPGRVRVHLPGWSGEGQRALETGLRKLPGVESAQANGLTSNVLIRFDPSKVETGTLFARLRALVSSVGQLDRDGPSPRHRAGPPAVVHERKGDVGRARIAVRGLDRDPAIAQKAVDALKKQPGVVRVGASLLTGRVLVEFSQKETTLDDLLAQVSNVELPPLQGEDRPSHPLDPGPMFQSGARVVGAGLGLGLLATQRLTGTRPSSSLQAAAVQTAAIAGILQSFPAIRSGLRRLLGHDVADIAISAPTILALTVAGSPLGLALTAAESMRLFTEVMSRRSSWRRYEESLETADSAQPGDTVRMESGEQTPYTCEVIEGFGTATSRSGLPHPAVPGETISAGARLFGGPFVLNLVGTEAFEPRPRPTPVAPSFYDRYLKLIGPVSLGYAALTALVTRSAGRTFQAFLLVNSRPAMIGAEGSDLGASARVLRSGVVVVGTRPDRKIRLPRHLIFDSPRVLSDGFAIAGAVAIDGASSSRELLTYAEGIAAAAGAPWGGTMAPGIPSGGGDGRLAAEGSFDGHTATAIIEGVRYFLGPAVSEAELPRDLRLRHRGDHILVLRRESEKSVVGFIALRPRLAAGVASLVDLCHRHGVVMTLLSAGHPLEARMIAGRAVIEIVEDADPVEAIVARQQDGSIVAFVSDCAQTAQAFDAADLAIGLVATRSTRFPARADLLAPDLSAVAAIVEAGARCEASVRDSVVLSIASNLFGAVWGIRSQVGLARASQAVYIASLGALADGWFRLRGGERPWSTIARLVDPRPERWGRRGIDDVLRALRTSERGLTSEEASRRRQSDEPRVHTGGVLQAMLDQLRSPLTAVLAAGATLSLILGSVADVVMIGLTLAANVLVGAWQERQTGQAIAALQQIGTSTARVFRDGEVAVVPAGDVVSGDVLALAPGDRVAADARVISAQALEVDEAALTGESFPVAKSPSAVTDAGRVVLAGSDVTVGTGRAVVFAVGRRTRLGATAAALALDETRHSPLGVRLNRMLRQILPLAAAGGVIVVLSGLVRRRPLLPQFAVGASIAIAAVPEGLPLLAGVGEAAVARRLAGRRALVRRLSAVEALGRVDVACTDKTGTLTEGRLALRTIATLDREAEPANIGSSPEETNLRDVLISAGLATPHPETIGAAAHPTDVAVAEGVRLAGLDEQLHQKRERELPFDPARSFHASVAGGRIRLKGAPEVIVPRCDSVRLNGRVAPLEDSLRESLQARAEELAGRGLRVLMVAEGPATSSLNDPSGLTALGFLGIQDPLREGVSEAVRRCHEAGVRVIMLTGDHPATARAIAAEAGLLNGEILSGNHLSGMDDAALDRALEDVTVIARVTPLDKLRIIESLQRRGHTVAMTGDGVNDAPALRLADVGVAMGKAGTEVARQAADVVLADDNFATLVEALVEGRSYWRNIRRALGLLLGGNLGELGMVVGASVLGLASPLLTRQILAVNLVTDVLPSLAVALQPPESRDLSRLAREGTAALDAPLRRDIWRRGVATASLSLLGFIATLGTRGLAEARSVAFAGVVSTQLAQTLDNGRSEGSLTRAVLGAVAGSTGVLVLALTVPPVRDFLGLVTPSPMSWALVAALSLASVVLGRGLGAARLSISKPSFLARPASVPVRS
jgi:cation-transporting P-type ATPase I